MRTPLLTVITSLVLVLTSPGRAQETPSDAGLLEPGAVVEKLAGGMKFLEGPVWLPRENRLVFSDIPADQLMVWSATNGVTTYRQPSGQANGNMLDREGRLLTCEHKGRRVSIQEADGTVRTVVDRFEGKRFNSPNDIVVKSDGTLWFTDPDFGLPRDGAGREMEGLFVYRLDPATGKTTRVGNDFEKPNGLCFSPDEKRLYISNTGKARNIRVFDVQPDGTLTGGDVFATLTAGVPDGIRCDELGRVWSSAGDGVRVFAPDGKLVGVIAVPESPANLCFGGPDGKTLFMTARTSLYSVRVTVRGAARPGR